MEENVQRKNYATVTNKVEKDLVYFRNKMQNITEVHNNISWQQHFTSFIFSRDFSFAGWGSRTIPFEESYPQPKTNPNDNPKRRTNFHGGPLFGYLQDVCHPNLWKVDSITGGTCFSVRFASLHYRICHCIKSVCIRSYSGPYFPPFRLNTVRYSVRTRVTPNTGTFYAVCYDRKK